jgi:glycosyltransferase involved in cell wall biosynthesis
MKLGVLTSHPIQYNAPVFRALARRTGVELEVFFCHDHGLKPSFDAGFGRTICFDVPLIEGYKHRFLRSFPRKAGVHPLTLAPEVLSPLLAERFDAIVVYGYATITNAVTLLLPRCQTRILLRGDSNIRQPRSSRKAALKSFVLPWLFRRVDQFLAIGSLNAEYYRSYGVPAERITLAPFSVDNGYFAERAARVRPGRDSLLRDMGLGAAGPVFLFAGKLMGLKRPLDILRAFATVRATRACSLAIAGDGALAAEAKREAGRLGIESHVRFLGFRNQSEIAALYGVCDVLVLASDTEPWGLVVNEAMAAGMCAIVSDQVGAGPDLVHDRELVFPSGNVAELARVMARMCDDPQWLAKCRREAGARIAGWDIENTVDGIVDGVAIALGRSRALSSPARGPARRRPLHVVTADDSVSGGGELRYPSR